MIKAIAITLAIWFLPDISCAQDDSQASFFEQKKEAQDKICSTAEQFIKQDQCLEAMDYLLSTSVSEDDLVDPVKVHLLLLESQACSGNVNNIGHFNDRLNEIEQTYQLDEADKRKIQYIRDLVSQKSSKPSQFHANGWTWPMLFVFVLSWAFAIFLRKGR